MDDVAWCDDIIFAFLVLRRMQLLRYDEEEDWIQRNNLAVIACFVLHEYEASQRERHYLRNNSLLGPGAGAGLRLLHARDDLAYMDVFSVNTFIFQRILDHGFGDVYAAEYSKVVRKRKPDAAHGGGRPMVTTASIALGMTLHYIASRDVNSSTSLAFGVGPAVTSRTIQVPIYVACVRAPW